MKLNLIMKNVNISLKNILKKVILVNIKNLNYQIECFIM